MRRHIIIIIIVVKQRPHPATRQYSRAASQHGWKEEATEPWINNTRVFKHRFKAYLNYLREKYKCAAAVGPGRASSLTCPRRLPVLAYRLR